MAEPFYGTVPSSPIWSGIPPGFGFFPAPFGIGVSQGAEGFGPSNIPQTSMAGLPTLGAVFPPTGALPGYGYGFAGGLMSSAPAGQLLGQPGPTAGAGAGTGGYAGLGGFELPQGITAPAVIAAVAMRRGQPHGPATDQDIEEFIFDALELLPGTNDVEVRVESGRVTLTGGVQQKRLKHDVGEIAWAIPSVNDVTNNLNIATRRRTRPSGREGESQQSGAAARKQG